jgi:hypothetical protein
MRRTPFGHRQGTTVGANPAGYPINPGVWTPTPDDYATKALLVAELATDRLDGNQYNVESGGAWQYIAAGTAVDASQNMVLAPYDGVGCYVLMPGELDLTLPFTFATADATVLFTVPTNARIEILRGFWQVTTGFTGGASAAIGASSSNAGYATKGDLLGGAAGDVAATLVVGNTIPGTVGAKFAGGVILVAGDTIKFNAITSAFTAGAGYLHLAVNILENPGL